MRPVCTVVLSWVSKIGGTQHLASDSICLLSPPVWHLIACKHQNHLYNTDTTHCQGTQTVVMAFPAVHCTLLAPCHIWKMTVVGNFAIWLGKNHLILRDGLIICFRLRVFILQITNFIVFHDISNFQSWVALVCINPLGVKYVKNNKNYKIIFTRFYTVKLFKTELCFKEI